MTQDVPHVTIPAWPRKYSRGLQLVAEGEAEEMLQTYFFPCGLFEVSAGPAYFGVRRPGAALACRGLVAIFIAVAKAAPGRRTPKIELLESPTGKSAEVDTPRWP